MTPLERDALPGALLDPLIANYRKVELIARSTGYPVGLTADNMAQICTALELCREALLIDIGSGSGDITAARREIEAP